MDTQLSPPEESAPQSELQTPSIQPQPESNHKMLFVIVGALLLLVIFFGSLYLVAQRKKQTIPEPLQTRISSKPTSQPTADENTEWKTYNTDAYSFQYPPTMTVELSSEPTIFYVHTIGYTEKNISTSTSEYQIQITKIAPETIEDFMKLEPNTPDYDLTESQNKIMINGAPAVAQTFKKELNGSETGWEIYKLYYIYSPSFGMIFKGTGLSHNILDQVVSTFQFTNQNKQVNMSSWRTYTNSGYGFSVRYPSDAIVKENSPKYISISRFDNIDGKYDDAYEFLISFFISDNPDEFLSQDVFSRSEELPYNNVSDVVIGNIKTTRRVGDRDRYSQSSLPLTSYLISKDNLMISIVTDEYYGKFNGTTTDAIKNETNSNKIVSKIVSTFQFTK